MLKNVDLKIITMIGWTTAVLLSLLSNAYISRQHSVETAHNIANANFDKDQAFRNWASTHGGVYVPADENRTPPSPYMRHISERDVTTESGRKLTLMNPAYMLRQMMDEYSGLYGAKGHITAIDVLNKKSNPDEWERNALIKFQADSSVKEVVEMTQKDGEDILRLIRPMKVSPNCLKCHGHQKSYLGVETAGGVSITVPMANIYNLAKNTFYTMALLHIIFWAVGIYIFQVVFIKEKISRETLRHFATHDSLTNLPNRYAFNQTISSMIDGCRENDKEFMLLFLDLDNFKMINDSLGHTIGDMLLIQVAHRLKELTHKYEIFSRFGGDEFVFIFSVQNNHTEAEQIALEIYEKLKEVFILDKFEVYTSASIGISLYPDHAKDPDSLLKYADIAMYNAKQSGKNQYRLFNDDILGISSYRLMLDGDLHKVLEKNELLLVYQPQVSMVSNKLVGVEALIRWEHPEKGMISPVDFIPIAEDNGLIIPIGEWIINEACDQLGRWKETDMRDISISINISVKQLLHQNLYYYIKMAIERNQINSNLLEIEITESVVMENILDVINILNSLKELGISIAIDDFGTGYSSLSYLKKLPIDKLKIDREFIKDIPEDKDDIAITKAIISLSKSLNLKVIAEGPETKEHIEFLQEHKCDIAQGFYYSKPLLAKDVELFNKKEH